MNIIEPITSPPAVMGLSGQCVSTCGGWMSWHSKTNASNDYPDGVGRQTLVYLIG